MQLHDLKRIVEHAINSGELSLATSALDSDDVTTVSAGYLPDDTLHLTNATHTHDDRTHTVTVHGTGVDYPFNGLQTTIVFSFIDDQVAFVMTGTQDAAWKFSEALPLFRKTFLANLTFRSVAVVLRTNDDDGEPAEDPLSFRGDLDLASLSTWTALFPDVLTLNFSGPIGLQDNGSNLNSLQLSADPLTDIHLGLVSADLHLEIGVWIRHNPSWQTYSAVPYIELETDMMYTDHEERTHHLPVSARTWGPATEIRFAADLADPISTTVDALRNLIGDDFDPGSIALPDGFELPPVLELGNFYFDFNVQSRKVTTIGVDLKSGLTWEVFEIGRSGQNLTLEEITLSFRFRNPFDNLKTWLGISGDIGIGDAGTMSVALYYPDWSLQGALKDGTTLKLDELLATILGPGSAVPPLNVGVLGFELSSGNYLLDVQVDGAWPLVPDSILSMREVRFYLRQQSAATEVRMHGVFDVTGADVYMTANYPSGDVGWTFTGSTGPGQAISVNDLAGDLPYMYPGSDASLPDIVSTLTIKDLAIAFNTRTQDFRFTGATGFRLNANHADETSAADAQEVDFALSILLQHGADGLYRKEIGGELLFRLSDTQSLGFHVRFAQVSQDSQESSGASDNRFVAGYHDDNAEVVSIQSLVGLIAGSPPPALAGVNVFLKEALLAYDRPATGNAVAVFRAALGSRLNLSQLPLFGAVLPPDVSLELDLELTYAQDNLTNAEAAAFNALLPGSVAPLPLSTADGSLAIPAGAGIHSQLRMGDVFEPVDFAIQLADTGGSAEKITAEPLIRTTRSEDGTNNDGVHWKTLQKTFGPLYLNKIGMQYANRRIAVYLDATIAAGGLRLGLEGLGVGVSVAGLTSGADIEPRFYLQGVELAYEKGPLRIDGYLLHRRLADADEYAGAAVIVTESLGLAALASYYTPDSGAPSLFVYGVLEYPLGGPPFFFIEGLSAGFGYNRALRMPGIDDVASFPLVAEVIDGTAAAPSNRSDLAAKLDQLEAYVPRHTGQYFFTAGVKFNSFKIIDAFALLAVSFGQRYEIDVLGLATAVAPPPSPDGGDAHLPRLAEVQMALRARYAPDEGVLEFRAQLTTASYILSRDCHLTGGFAFYAWTADQANGARAGDFVQTLGGYHPAFEKPAHYPAVPRLGFLWRLNDALTLKGDLYFAFCAHALMAGGNLEAVWKSGHLKAWFLAGVDLLLNWKPYYYSGGAHVSIGATYQFKVFGSRKKVTFTTGAHLELWGPDFAGRLHVDYYVVSFTIRFGAPKRRPPAVDWHEFRASFLPGQYLSVAARAGLIGQDAASTGDAVQLGTLNPTECTLVIDSAIPTKKVFFNQQPQDLEPPDDFAVRPVRIPADQLNVSQHISVTRSGQTIGMFECTPIRKDMPAALWGEPLRDNSPDVNDGRFVSNLVTGLIIQPRSTAPGGGLAGYETTLPRQEGGVFAYAPFRSPHADDMIESPCNTIAEDIMQGDAATAGTTVHRRNEVLSALGLSANDIDLDASVAEMFFVPPRIVASP